MKFEDFAMFPNLQDQNLQSAILNYQLKKKLRKNNDFLTPFYGPISTVSRLEPLRGGSLLFTTKSPEIPGTHFIDLGGMKD